MKKKVGIIGFGGMGKWHAGSITGNKEFCGIQFNVSDVVELAGVYDIDPAKNADAAERFGLKVYESRQAMLADPEVDIVVIATPNDVHEEIAIEALNAGKNVISEKPVTMSCEALENMIAAAEKNGKIFSVHQNRRLDDYYVTMRNIIESDKIGEVISVESRVQSDHGIPGDWRKTLKQGGGMLYDWGVHMIDQQLWMLGYDVDRVYAHFDQLTGVEVDDGCYVDIYLKSGPVLRVEICTYNFITLPLMYVRGRLGTALAQTWFGGIDVVRCTDWGDHDDILPVRAAAGFTKTMAPRSDRAIERSHIEYEKTDVHNYYRNFCAAIDGKEELLVNHDQMRMVMKVIMAAFESVEKKCVVKL